MRDRPDSKSPFGKRRFIEDHEFESLAEDQIQRAGSGVFEPGRGIDIDRILERVHGVVPDYSELPAGVLGRALFSSSGAIKIEINLQLDQQARTDEVQRRRLRSTAAHECGHVVCHRSLLTRDQLTGSLFAEVKEEKALVADRAEILCRGSEIEEAFSLRRAYDGQWWEYQANRFMATVLLPRSLMQQALQDFARGFGRSATLRPEDSSLFAGAMAERFDVNPIMVKYRIQELGWVSRDPDQESLAFDSNGE